MRLVLVFVGCLFLIGCTDGFAPPELGEVEQAVIGGSPAPNDPAVVQVRVGGLCTGSLVAPRVVLTAAHCISDAIVAGQTAVGSVGFGEGGGAQWIDQIGISDMIMHRRYVPPAFVTYDIAVLRLSRDAPADIEIVPIRTLPLTDDDIGLQVRTVGFGHNETDGADIQSGAGTKRQITMSVDEVTSRHIGVGNRIYNTCQGDSGGPTFIEVDGEEQVAGVTSFGASGCEGRSYLTRTDIMWDDLLAEVLDAWSGPCPNDNVCDEDCELPDPDCDPCGFEGNCTPDCAKPDFDCTLGGTDGDRCEDEFDCESRLCIESLEDPRLKYCSIECDPEVSDSCGAPLSRCVPTDGGGQCMYSTITPGSQGSPCDTGGDCRSNMCDTRSGICVEACGEGEPQCLEGYECQARDGLEICGLPEEGGCGCRSSGSTGPLASLLVLVLLLGRRRKSNSACRKAARA